MFINSVGLFCAYYDRAGFVRYELYFGELKNELLVLQFCVRDNEDIDEGASNFVHISNIVIPYNCRRHHIASDIITIMSGIANKEMGIHFYVTSIVNDEWKSKLISNGGIEDEDGDIEIYYDRWVK